jgi:Zn-dependent protease
VGIAPWLANWWSLLALIGGLGWGAWRAARVRSVQTAVACATAAGSIAVMLLPLSWHGQQHRALARSVDVVARATAPELRSDPELKAWFGRGRGLRASAVQRANSDGTYLVLVRRQSNRVPGVALQRLLQGGPTGDVPTITSVEPGALSGAAGCAVAGSGARCAWADRGTVGLVTSSDIDVTRLAPLLLAERAEAEYPRDRYHPYREGLTFSLMLLLGIALMVASIVLHEVAHAVIARLLGAQVLTICIGAGALLLDRDVHDIRVLVRVIPLGGYVQIVQPNARTFRRNQALVCSAGPLMNVVLSVIAGVALGWTHPLAILNGLLALANAVPYSKQIPEAGRRVGTDGYQVIEVLSRRRVFDPASQVTAYEVRIETALDRGDTAAARNWADRGLAAHPDAPELNVLLETISAASK